ncbi:hypothetical protein ACIBG7_27095 [Nonomuraea sp. NPDC050328]|uniref:hypothetical protein n=1 Tax=Nonomuraea sp. NPDC050328 TaxID=3364361 RepID=UPI0037BA55D1
MTWLTGSGVEPADAFAGVVGVEAAVTAWRRRRIEGRAAPNTINQGVAALTLMYVQMGLRIDVKRATVPKPGEPDALTAVEHGAVERAAARRGVFVTRRSSCRPGSQPSHQYLFAGWR